MQIRTPAVAGMFYPSEPRELKSLVHDCFMHPFGPGKVSPSESTKKIFGIICPHAGYVYSGPIACHSFYKISSSPIELFIIIGPNHWGIGCNVASMKDCSWETPLGNVEVDSESVKELSKISGTIELDFFSHYEENNFAHKQDKALIEPILNLDLNSFYKILNEKKITACGYGAIATTMVACKELGATKGELLKYATSGDITGDKSSVVGYGSIIFT